MARRTSLLLAGSLTLSIALAIAAGPAHALEVWSGRTHSFSKANFADWTQAANQDRITPAVWLTRQNSHGLYNIHTEPAFGFGSPNDTEWATGNAVDHASLLFQSWRDWAMFNPPGTVGVDAVVHLISEDIYVDIRFDSWTNGVVGVPAGGGFSYTRAVKPTTSVVSGVAAFAIKGFRGNPVRANAPVEFSLPDAAPAKLEVLDVAGRVIASREVGWMGAGGHSVELPELRAMPPGLVFVRLTRAGQSVVARGTHLR